MPIPASLRKQMCLVARFRPNAHRRPAAWDRRHGICCRSTTAKPKAQMLEFRGGGSGRWLVITEQIPRKDLIAHIPDLVGNPVGDDDVGLLLEEFELIDNL